MLFRSVTAVEERQQAVLLVRALETHGLAPGMALRLQAGLLPQLALEHLQRRVLRGQGRVGGPCLGPGAQQLPGGRVVPIEELKALEGKAMRAVIPREAMGMGDVHLLGMIGAFFGWTGVFFSLFSASFFAIIAAVIGRIGFTPFGWYRIVIGVVPAWLASPVSCTR